MSKDDVRYELRHGVSGTDRDTWETHATFDNGKDAASAKASLSELMAMGMLEGSPIPPNHVLAIVRVTGDGSSDGDANWRDREAARFAEGRYKRVPWDETDHRGQNWTSFYPDHFVHIAENDSRKVAFTPSDEMGRKGRKTILDPAVYLGRFYGDEQRQSDPDSCSCCKLSMQPEQKAAYVELIAGDGSNVRFAHSADEIQEAYERMRRECCHDVTSCMTYPAKDFNTGGVHPVRAYAAGDLALAWVEDGRGHIYGRALVWPEKKIWGRTYGSGSDKLRVGLRALGYTNGGSDALDGARLTKIPHPSGEKNVFVVPYIDGSQRFADSGEFFVIDDSGDYKADRTDGIAYCTPQVECERCGDDVNEGETYTVEDETWCCDCTSSYAFTCDCCDLRFRGEDAESVVHIERHGPIQCYACPDCLNEFYTETHDGQLVRNADVTQCTDCDDYFVNGDINGNGVCDGCQELRDEAEAEADALLSNEQTELDLGTDDNDAIAA